MWEILVSKKNKGEKEKGKGGQRRKRSSWFYRMNFFEELLHEMLYSTSMNLSLLEVIFLAVLAVLVWLSGRKKPKILLYYSIFLIIYITLLRRKYPLEPAHLAKCRNLGRKFIESVFICADGVFYAEM